MATPGMTPEGAPTRASDSLQAAYFRGALADQRAVVAAEVARHVHALNSLATRSDAMTISQLRRQIRAYEAECRELDRMIEAIDRRFAPGWADQT